MAVTVRGVGGKPLFYFICEREEKKNGGRSRGRGRECEVDSAISPEPDARLSV